MHQLLEIAKINISYWNTLLEVRDIKIASDASDASDVSDVKIASESLFMFLTGKYIWHFDGFILFDIFFHIGCTHQLYRQLICKPEFSLSLFLSLSLGFSGLLKSFTRSLQTVPKSEEFDICQRLWKSSEKYGTLWTPEKL